MKVDGDPYDTCIMQLNSFRDIMMVPEKEAGFIYGTQLVKISSGLYNIVFML